ncbi:GNAT family N-acetyltransferase [Asanoa sp. NPDC049573]|uniref:GNAT family N-acetyltransferase n=1 Tax=Asanoa sp. NPDC049573 TaxID=3155396 RepID=UPI003439C9C1
MSDATPEEVMPPVEGPPGWTEGRQEFFRAFHRERRPGLDGPLRTVMFAIETDTGVIGMIRMTLDDDGTAETGMWLARSARGRGLGTEALRTLLDEARAAGARTVRADTTPGNKAALAVLGRTGAALVPDGDKVYARLELDS